MPMTVPHRLITIAAAATLGGCAAMGGGGGGGDNLPNRGVVPYERLLDDNGEAVLFALISETPDTLIYVEPHALVTEDQQVLLFAEAYDLDSRSGAIVRCDLDATFRCPSPRTVLTPSDNEWLAGRVGAPSLVRQDGDWLMAFAYGEGHGIGLAWSVDGEDFVLEEAPLLVASGPYEEGGINSPSLIRTDTGYRLYYEGRDAEGISRILAADGDFGLTFERVGVALDRGLACLDLSGQPDTCWDAGGVGGPEVRLATTGAGRAVFRLFYTGLGATGLELGFAASWDGLAFERFVYNPVIATDASERQATNVQVGERYLLFFEERISNTVRGIAVSTNDTPAPSESL
jgi:hypothetical protein